MTSVAQYTQREASCHCGAIKLTIPELPTTLNECRCSICFKYGALWSYHPRNKVIIKRTSSDSLKDDTYCWGDRTLKFHRCNECGCVTHWQEVKTISEDSEDIIGVNCRMLKAEVTTAIAWQVTTGPEFDHLFYNTTK